jgi:hypothetical protein
VPSQGVEAVAVNVTVIGGSVPGFVTVYPLGDPLPATSNVNFSAGQTVANYAQVALGSGKLEVVVSAPAQVILDVEGYFGVGDPSDSNGYVPVSPARICDTRAGNPSDLSGAEAQCDGHGPVVPSAPLVVQVAGVGPVPSQGVAGVVLHVTALGESGPGYLSVYPAGEQAPVVSALNLAAGLGAVGNSVTVKLGANGEVQVATSESLQVVIDVEGYFAATGASFVPLAQPARVVDTRCDVSSPPSFCSGEHLPKANLSLPGFSPGSESSTLQVAGVDQIPTDATAALVNLTVTETTIPGYLSATPGKPTGAISDVNWEGAETVASTVPVGLSATGSLTLSASGGSSQVVVDVEGYYES